MVSYEWSKVSPFENCSFEPFFSFISALSHFYTLSLSDRSCFLGNKIFTYYFQRDALIQSTDFVANWMELNWIEIIISKFVHLYIYYIYKIHSFTTIIIYKYWQLKCKLNKIKLFYRNSEHRKGLTKISKQQRWVQDPYRI